jgi:NAD(P)-dependent dehydrogenase (short-subunit alcohol dehydrogenase family)
MGKLDGKVALVTGAGGGIGRCHAMLLAEHGASVVVNDLGGARDGTGNGKNMADQVVEEISAAGGSAVADYGSVSNSDDAAKMTRTAVDNFGRLDILINNAGILRDKSFKHMTDEMWDAVIDVHLNGTYRVTRAAWNQMIEQGEGGRVINTSSTSGLMGNFGQANYAAAKAGIAGLTRVLAIEGRKDRITVNTLAPGAFSRMTEDLMDLMPDSAEDAMAPHKVSPAVVFLCTDDAKDITGRQFGVRGNRVSLLSWQMTEIADRDAGEDAWTVEDIGEKIMDSFESWPKPLNPMEF